MTTTTDKPTRRPSGSDKRQRPHQTLIRWSDEEFADAIGKADQSGLARAAFMRAAILGNPGPRAQRRPPADHKALRQLLGETGRISNNANECARVLKTVQNASLPEAQRALLVLVDINQTLRDIRNAIYDALGKNHDPAP